MSENTKSDNEYWPGFRLLWTAAMVVSVCFSFYTLGYRWGEHDATLRAQAAIDKKLDSLREQGGCVEPAYRTCVFTSKN